jgi:hypothetical protein
VSSVMVGANDGVVADSHGEAGREQTVSEAVRCQFCMAVLSEVGSDTWDGEHKDWCPVVERES